MVLIEFTMLQNREDGLLFCVDLYTLIVRDFQGPPLTPSYLDTEIVMQILESGLDQQGSNFRKQLVCPDLDQMMTLCTNQKSIFPLIKSLLHIYFEAIKLKYK